MFLLNTALFWALGSWGNQWIAIVAAVGLIVMCLIGIFNPAYDGKVTFMTEGDTRVVIPSGTRLQTPDDSIQLVTTRTVGIRWYTRLWCRLRSKPLPTSFEVPVKRVDN